MRKKSLNACFSLEINVLPSPPKRHQNHLDSDQNFEFFWQTLGQKVTFVLARNECQTLPFFVCNVLLSFTWKLIFASFDLLISGNRIQWWIIDQDALTWRAVDRCSWSAADMTASEGGSLGILSLQTQKHTPALKHTHDISLFFIFYLKQNP